MAVLAGGTEIENSYGPYLLMEKTVPACAGRPSHGRPGADWDPADSVMKIARDLQLVYGIGPVNEGLLKAEGYETVFDLLRHEKWAARALPVVRALQRADGKALAACGARDLEILGLSGPEQVAYLDIETSGLSSTSALFMVGLLIPAPSGEGSYRLCQLFARNYDEELAVLDEAVRRIADIRAIITYNGKSFDIPFIRRRLAYYGLDDEWNACTIDLCHPARRRYSSSLPDCRLSTLEAFVLGRPRAGDVPGRLIPDIYNEYVRTGDGSLIEQVIFHNELDLLAMAHLLPLLA